MIEKYGSKVLEPFGDVGTFAPNLAPEHSINIFGAGQRYLFLGAGRGGAGRASLVTRLESHKGVK